VTISFKKKRSVAGVLNDAAVDELRYGPILSQLKEIWTSKGYGKFLHDYIFVYSTVTAASGSLIYSEESNNTVKLAHQSGEGVTKLADLGSGNFEYLSNTKSTLEIIRAVAHKPLFKAFTFRKNWEPEILG
jgi:hypothetical protein